MKNDPLVAKLYNKMQQEQNEYRAWLLAQPPEEILNHAYEYSSREDILIALENASLRPAQLRALLESQAPLADIYKDYRDCDTNTLDVMTLCIADRADIDLMESTKKNWPPVYYQTGRYAREHEELPQYRASMKLNEECRDEIDDAISYNYNGLCLDDGAVQQVLAGYGAERTRYIVAAAIQVRDGDARISPQNRRWADSVRTIQDINADGYDKAVYYANTFNFMVSILYTQLFDQLFRLADSTPEFHGTLPVHVRLMMDEFANVATPENFVKILAVARSRNISCDIILQNISQIKSKYKDDWETIIGNCDSLVYLGGNDYSTFEYISKLLGKQTIRTKGQSIGKGSHGSSSDSYQVTGRELMTPDEVRRMKRSDCLVMISGEAPVRDKKYNLFDHPNLKYTPDYRSPRGLLHRAATPIPAPEGYTMPPDYMAQAGTVSLAYVAELTCPEITEDLYDELQEWEESLL